MLFLILDPSLYDSGGHNLDYVLAIVKELELQGIKPKIYANYKYNITTSNDANIDVIPFFGYAISVGWLLFNPTINKAIIYDLSSYLMYA